MPRGWLVALAPLLACTSAPPAATPARPASTVHIVSASNPEPKPPSVCANIAGVSNEPVAIPEKAGESMALLARARGVRSAREAELARCAGTDDIRLVRTRGEAPAIAVVFPIAWDGPIPKGLAVHHPLAIDGVPLVFMVPICTLELVTFRLNVVFAPKSTALDAAATAALEKAATFLALRPEYGEIRVDGLATSPLLAKRRASVRSWLMSHDVEVSEVVTTDDAPATDADTIQLHADRAPCSFFR